MLAFVTLSGASTFTVGVEPKAPVILTSSIWPDELLALDESSPESLPQAPVSTKAETTSRAESLERTGKRTSGEGNLCEEGGTHHRNGRF